MTQTPTKTRSPNVRTKVVFTDVLATPMEAIYPRAGFARVEGKIKPVYLGHSKTRCDGCEYEFGAERQHPKSDQVENAVVLCGGHLMTFTDKPSL